MKTQSILMACAAMVAVFTSCEETPDTKAQQKIDKYTTYVDSVSSAKTEEIAMNWNTVERDYNNYKMEANEAILTVDDNSDLQKSIDNSTKKYEDFKFSVEKEVAEKSKQDSKEMIRKTLLGKDFDGSDMSYTWINKDNILNVYENFVNTVDQNKDSYSREDWDEIKLMYEAIDSRKNTVENEGLTGEDNRDIAALKLKFAPMYTLNRMGAKSDENQEAKQ